MDSKSAWTLVLMLLSLAAASVAGAAPSKGQPPGLTVNSTIEAGTTREYSDPDAVILSNGFWAKTGSTVTIATTFALLQLTDEPIPQPVEDPFDRSPGPPPDCPDGTDHPCASGYQGQSSFEVDIGHNAKLPNPVDYYGIRAVNVIQNSRGNPCKLMLWGNMLEPRYSDPDPRLLAVFELDRCIEGFSPLPLGMISVDFEQTDRFVRALQVCSHTQPAWARQEIKGLAIRAGEVYYKAGQASGATPLDNVVFDKRPNCRKRTASADSEEIHEGVPGAGNKPGWENWSTCPDGQIASGITVYVDENKSFSGMRIECKYLRRLSGPAPKKDDQGY